MSRMRERSDQFAARFLKKFKETGGAAMPPPPPPTGDAGVDSVIKDLRAARSRLRKTKKA